MKRLPVGSTFRVTGSYFAGRTGVILADDWRVESSPDYQRVQLDGGDEHLLLAKHLERFEKKGQQSLFGEVAA
jgi:hypothetical protein